MDAAQRWDPPAVTAPGVAAKIVLSMANMEQISPQAIWTSVMRELWWKQDDRPLCCMSGICWQCFHQRGMVVG